MVVGFLKYFGVAFVERLLACVLYSRFDDA